MWKPININKVLSWIDKQLNSNQISRQTAILEDYFPEMYFLPTQYIVFLFFKKKDLYGKKHGYILMSNMAG